MSNISLFRQKHCHAGSNRFHGLSRLNGFEMWTSFICLGYFWKGVSCLSDAGGLLESGVYHKIPILGWCSIDIRSVCRQQATRQQVCQVSTFWHSATCICQHDFAKLSFFFRPQFKIWIIYLHWFKVKFVCERALKDVLFKLLAQNCNIARSEQ